MAGLLAGEVAFWPAPLPSQPIGQWRLGVHSAYSRGGGCGIAPPTWVRAHRIPCSSVTP